MNVAFYSGASGLFAYQESLNVTGHNLANVGTVGFKSERSIFEDLVYTRMGVNGENDHLVGHGTKSISRDVLFGQGNLNQTGGALDYTIVGDCFFAVERNGKKEYTRNGAFEISLEGDTGFLVSSDGAYVLDAAGQHIELPRKTDKDGTVIAGTTGFDLAGVKEKLGIYAFHNVYGLTPTTRSSFNETAVSGPAVAVNVAADAEGGTAGPDTAAGKAVYNLLEATLEQSAVNMEDEMTNMITAQRGYQFSSKVVQTADNIEEILNNLR